VVAALRTTESSRHESHVQENGEDQIVKIISHAGILLLLFSLVGCGGSVKRLQLESLPEPPAGKGLVCFFRDGAFLGSAVSFSVYDEREKIGVLQSGTYFFVEAEPGLHTYVAKTEVSDRLHVVVEENQTVFIAGSAKLGAFVGQPVLRLANESEGRARIKELRPIAWEP